MASLGRRIERMLPRGQRVRRGDLPAGDELGPAIAAMVRALPEPRLLRLVYDRLGAALGLHAPAGDVEPELEHVVGLIEGIEVDLDRWVRARSRAELIQIVTPWIRAHVLGQASAAEPAPEMGPLAAPSPSEPSPELQALLVEAVENGGYVRLAHAPMCPVAPGMKARAGGEIVDNADPCDCWVGRARALLGLPPLEHVPAPGPTALDLQVQQEREEALDRLRRRAIRWKGCAKRRVPQARHLEVLAELQGARGAVATLGEELQAARELLDEAGVELVAARAGAAVTLAAAVQRAEAAEAATDAARTESATKGAAELRAARLDAEEVRRERGDLLRALEQHRAEVRDLTAARQRDAGALEQMSGEVAAQTARADGAETRLAEAGISSARAQEEATSLRARVALLEGQLAAAKRERCKPKKALPLKRNEADWVEEVREMLVNELRRVLPGEAERVEEASDVRTIKGLAEMVRAHADPEELSNGLRKILGLTEEELEAARAAPIPPAHVAPAPHAERPPRAPRARRSRAKPAPVPAALPVAPRPAPLALAETAIVEEDEAREPDDDVPDVEEDEAEKPVAAPRSDGVVFSPDEVRRRLNARLLEQRERQRVRSGFYLEVKRTEDRDGDGDESDEDDEESEEEEDESDEKDDEG